MWDAVKWSMAGQVAALFKLSDEGQALLIDDDPPERFFAALRDADMPDDAIWLLALALPRRAAIAWAHRCVGASGQRARLLPRDMAAYSATSAWLEDGSDKTRWIAQSAALEAELNTPEALLAYAVFFSGGSLTPADSPQPVPAAPDLVGRLVAAAVLLAALRAAPAQMAAAKSQFLDLGAAFAQEGGDTTKHLDPAAWADDLAPHAPDAENRKSKRPPQRPTADPSS